MDTVITGVCIGVSMLIINGIVMRIKNKSEKTKKEAETALRNQSRIVELEAKTDETKEIAKLTLATCVILGDGMIQNGINGDFKKAFCEKKQDALKML